MTNKQKRQLALILLHKVSEIVEFWGENEASRALLKESVSVDEAAQQLANWLKILPGDDWVTCLPQPRKQS